MKKPDIGFATAGSVMSILFFMIVNYSTSPNHIWFIYPSFPLLLWPVSLYLIKKGKHIQHALFASLVIIFFFITINYIQTPGHPWFLYASFPIIWWPIFLFLGKRAKTMTVASLGSIVTILYYCYLNVIISPPYPWVIYPAFAVLWWPLTLYFGRKKKYFELSVSGSLLIIIFFISVNVVSSPQTVWAVYPIFLVLWWPLSMYYFILKRKPLFN